jgi:hypothetical protein
MKLRMVAALVLFVTLATAAFAADYTIKLSEDEDKALLEIVTKVNEKLVAVGKPTYTVQEYLELHMKAHLHGLWRMGQTRSFRAVDKAKFSTAVGALDFKKKRETAKERLQKKVNP